MSRKSSVGGRRAWDVLRLALLWARRGNSRLVITTSLLQKGIRKLRHSHHHAPPRGALVYGERELSFDDTPVVHVKMHRPSSLRFKMPQMPCIKPHVVDFDYEFEFDDDDYGYGGGAAVEEVEEEVGVDEGIDLKAEEFIAKFYEQMKLQRQVSICRDNGGTTIS